MEFTGIADTTLQSSHHLSWFAEVILVCKEILGNPTVFPTILRSNRSAYFPHPCVWYTLFSAPLKINILIFDSSASDINIIALLSTEDQDPVQAVFPHCYHPYVTSCKAIWNFIPFLVCSFNSWKLWWDVHLYWTHFSNVSTALNNLTHRAAFYKLIFVAFFLLTWFTCQTMYLSFHRLFPSGDCISSFWQFLDSISKCNYCTLLSSVPESLEIFFIFFFCLEGVEG